MKEDEEKNVTVNAPVQKKKFVYSSTVQDLETLPNQSPTSSECKISLYILIKSKPITIAQ